MTQETRNIRRCFGLFSLIARARKGPQNMRKPSGIPLGVKFKLHIKLIITIIIMKMIIIIIIVIMITIIIFHSFKTFRRF